MTTKLYEPVGRVQFVVFEKCASGHLHQTARKIILLLMYNPHEKSITESRAKRNFDSLGALVVICTRVT